MFAFLSSWFVNREISKKSLFPLHSFLMFYLITSFSYSSKHFPFLFFLLPISLPLILVLHIFPLICRRLPSAGGFTVYQKYVRLKIYLVLFKAYAMLFMGCASNITLIRSKNGITEPSSKSSRVCCVLFTIRSLKSVNLFFYHYQLTGYIGFPNLW